MAASELPTGLATAEGGGMTLRVLDLFCCAGGATRGYQKAGFEVVGVDIASRENYCGIGFLRADALDVLEEMVHNAEIYGHFDLIHASPPCQAASTLTRGTNKARGWGRTHHQLIPQVRALLLKIGLPYVLEHPAGHGGVIRTDVRLCMEMFPIPEPPWVQRHRDFEIFGFHAVQPAHPRHRGYVRGVRHGIYRDGPYVAAYGGGGGKATVTEMRHALGIDWTWEREELTEAIPPAYTAYLGGQLLRHRG